MSLRSALDRTILLMRDDINDDAADDLLLDTLVGLNVALVADHANIKTHSAQSAFISAAMLFARAGATVYLCAPNIALLGPQPPLRKANLIDALIQVNGKLIPKLSFMSACPTIAVDLAVLLGNSKWNGNADLILSINADDWSCWVSEYRFASPWLGADWPFGGLGASALAAAEGYKTAMRKLRNWRKHDIYDEYFAPTLNARVDLAPTSTKHQTNLGSCDFVSGGAIAHSTIFSLSRIIDVLGRFRVIEPDANDISNANRYSLLTLDRLPLLKALDLETQNFGKLKIIGLPWRYSEQNRDKIGVLAPSVLVGVDHIPSRWEVQKAMPDWLCIGATSHYHVMTTIHQSHLPCAKCAHPRDDGGNEPIPTAAFVSFWAGLLLAARYVRYMENDHENPKEQQIWFCPLRPERPPKLTGVHPHLDCPCASKNVTKPEALGQKLDA